MSAYVVTSMRNLRGAHRLAQALPHWSPKAVPIAGTIVGWVAVLALERHSSAPASAPNGHLHHLAAIAAMTFAMMSPLAIGLAVGTQKASLWWRVPHNVLSSYLGFITAWLCICLVLHPLIEVVSGSGRRLVVAAFALAVAVSHLRRKRDEGIARCALSRPLRPRRGSHDAASLGVGTAMRCVRTCGPTMALAMVTQSLLALAAVSILVVFERCKHPRPKVILCLSYLGVGAGLVLTK